MSTVYRILLNMDNFWNFQITEYSTQRITTIGIHLLTQTHLWQLIQLSYKNTHACNTFTSMHAPPHRDSLIYWLIHSLSHELLHSFSLTHTLHSHHTLRHPHNRLMMLISRLGQELMDPSHSTTQVYVCVYMYESASMETHTYAYLSRTYPCIGYCTIHCTIIRFFSRDESLINHSSKHRIRRLISCSIW